MLVKIVSRWFFPVPMICEFLLVGLILLWFTRRQKAGKALVTIGTALLILLGNRAISAWLPRPLEQRYPRFFASPLPSSADSPQKGMFIVVLSGGFSTDEPRVDMVSHLTEETAVRLMAGIRLYNEMQGSKFLLSGGPPADADSMEKVALALGVKIQDITLESESGNTEQEAAFIAPMVGKEPFILVTSASHMPRAMALFRNRGMRPIPAPTNFLSQRTPEWDPDEIYPSYYGLYEAERAVYEYLGIAWERLKHEI